MFGVGKLEGKALYNVMSAACGSAFMLYGECPALRYIGGIRSVSRYLTLMLTEIFGGIGWGAGVLGGIQETPQFRDAIGNPEGDFIIPIIASIYNLAAGIMSLCVTFFAMQLGRKGTILLGCLFICIGSVSCTSFQCRFPWHLWITC